MATALETVLTARSRRVLSATSKVLLASSVNSLGSPMTSEWWEGAPDFLWEHLPPVEKEAAKYYTTLRAAEQVGGRFVATATPVRGQGIRDLVFGGPTIFKPAEEEIAEMTALRSAYTYFQKTAYEGFREAVRENAVADPRSVGATVINSPKACDFCKMMRVFSAGNYTEKGIESFGNTWSFHDNCRCTLRPIFAGQGTQLTASELELYAKADERYRDGESFQTAFFEALKA